jgi:hypothetical protein
MGTLDVPSALSSRHTELTPLRGADRWRSGWVRRKHPSIRINHQCELKAKIGERWFVLVNR